MRRTSLVLAGLVGLGVAGATRAATTIVTPSDVGTLASNPNGWHYGAANPSPNGTLAQFVNGPAPTPLGTGSYQNNMTDQYVSLNSGNLYQGMRLADLESVSFSYYRNSADPTSTEEMIVLLRIDDDGDLNTPNTVNGRIWLQPRQTPLGVVGFDTWTTATGNRDEVYWEVAGFGPSTTESLDDFYASYPNAILVGNAVNSVQNSHRSTISIAAGSGGTHHIGNFDNLRFTWDNDPNHDPLVDVALFTDVYDFELVPEPASFGLLAAGAGLSLLRRKRV